MKKFLPVVLIVVLFCALFAGCNKKEDNALTVGMELAYPPFETKDAQGNPTGISVDFAKSLGEYLGRPVKIENIAWDGLIPALQTGQVDIVISSMTIKEERLEKIDFSKPYAKAMLAVLVNKNSNIKSINDLNQSGKKIAVKLNSTGHIYAQNNLKNAELIVLADESACVTEVVQGKADGFIYDQLTIYRNNQNNLDTTGAIFIPFQDAEYWGAGIQKGNTELKTKVDEFIDKFYSEGGFDKLTEKYLSQEKKTFEDLGFDWFFSLD
ncbi:cystine-binding periplasmic protein precursor [Oxobacter pfennigii]|uniref:Cystine-binding periplasmic protein n=1 Tax=Oxobacter pfennigii TaxID=36849 RepID=A0A0P8YRW8_9CLOT|nr:transporter substrate-binding domain-containing protein [Oxobacter pfennigii]KPU42359.1 cystine-binding periplasmic protein precursor [Oxobacter pfennigii]